MPPMLFMRGQRFGRLVGVRFVEMRDGSAFWEFRCDCGNTKVMSASKVKYRKGGCGCRRSDRKRESAARPEVNAWRGMQARCYNQNDKSWANYGGRGIRVHLRWRLSFHAFLEDMGPRPSPQHSLDRRDVNGHYEPRNCRWATTKEQARNKRTTILTQEMVDRIRSITDKGPSEIAREMGLKRELVGGVRSGRFWK